MELDVAEDFLSDLVPDGTAERNEHRFRERKGHKLLHYRIMVADERQEVPGLGTEAELD